MKPLTVAAVLARRLRQAGGTTEGSSGNVTSQLTGAAQEKKGVGKIKDLENSLSGALSRREISLQTCLLDVAAGQQRAFECEVKAVTCTRRWQIGQRPTPRRVTLPTFAAAALRRSHRDSGCAAAFQLVVCAIATWHHRISGYCLLSEARGSRHSTAQHLILHSAASHGHHCIIGGGGWPSKQARQLWQRGRCRRWTH